MPFVHRRLGPGTVVDDHVPTGPNQLIHHGSAEEAEASHHHSSHTSSSPTRPRTVVAVGASHKGRTARTGDPGGAGGVPCAGARTAADRARRRAGGGPQRRDRAQPHPPADLVADSRPRGVPVWVPADLGGAEVAVADGARRDRGAGLPRRFHRLVRDDRHDDRSRCGGSSRGARRGIYGAARAVTGGFAVPVGPGHAVDGGGSRRGPVGVGVGHPPLHLIGGRRLRPALTAGRAAGRRPSSVRVLRARRRSSCSTRGTSPGLRGTGSTDYAVHDAFVPEGRWVEIGRTARWSTAPCTASRSSALLALGVASVAPRPRPGAALDELVALAGGKVPQSSADARRTRAPCRPRWPGRGGAGAARPRSSTRPSATRGRPRGRATVTTSSAARCGWPPPTRPGGRRGDDRLLPRRRRRVDPRGAARCSGCSATCTSPPSTPWSPPAPSNRSAASASASRPTPAS